MAIARRNTSGCRQIVATALNAPIDAPAVMISISGDEQSLRIRGTISLYTSVSNLFCSNEQYSAECCFDIQALPAIESVD